MLESLLNSVSFTSVEFRDPWFLLAALVAPIIYMLASRLPAAVTYSSLQLMAGGPRSWRLRLANLPALLLALAALILVIALAGPRSGEATSKVKREGIAMMLAVDRSGSMDARDFVAEDYSVSRLDAVKAVLQDFVSGGKVGQGREDDLLGIVSFATYADGICPLTLDHANLLAILEDINVARERSESATAIGEGLGLAVERLRVHESKSKVIILLSDGVNNAGNLDPLQAAQLAKDHQIKVYTIGAGITGFAPMPVYDRTGQVAQLRRSRVEIDEKTLQAIAEHTGGRYFHARDAEGLADVYSEIDRLERSEITELRYLQYEEHYAWFVCAALLLVLLASLSHMTWLRRLP